MRTYGCKIMIVSPGGAFSRRPRRAGPGVAGPNQRRIAPWAGRRLRRAGLYTLGFGRRWIAQEARGRAFALARGSWSRGALAEPTNMELFSRGVPGAPSRPAVSSRSRDTRSTDSVPKSLKHKKQIQSAHDKRPAARAHTNIFL